ncbi:hypothetical protein [Paraburkholderia atlantica]|nr:hypothetical protein [Paraburkholderia atlantica]
MLLTRHFLNALQTGGAPVLTTRDARQVLRFSSAAEQSAREGKAIRLAF